MFTALGTINANRKKDNVDKQFIIHSKNNISTKDQADWYVRGSMMILDAIDSICWGWILLKYGAKKSVHRYCEWFKRLTRKNAQRLPQIKTLWEAFSWEIAMQMRSKNSFDTITENLNDTRMQSPPKKLTGESKDGGYRRSWTRLPKSKSKGRGWSKWSYSQNTTSPPAPNNYGRVCFRRQELQARPSYCQPCSHRRMDTSLEALMLEMHISWLSRMNQL